MERMRKLVRMALVAALGIAGCGGLEPGIEDEGVEVESLSSMLVASPSAVVMPDTKVGLASTKLVILTNDKSQITTITGYHFNPTWSGAYSYSPAMATIQPGASITTGVTFRPGTVGQQDTRLFIHHKLGSVLQPDLVIDVKGKGIP